MHGAMGNYYYPLLAEQAIGHGYKTGLILQPYEIPFFDGNIWEMEIEFRQQYREFNLCV
jgi:hypothetical protein